MSSREVSGLRSQSSGCRGGACPRPGEAKPSRLFKEEREGQAPSLYQVIYNQ